tara:strand:+ start:1626 stop:1865 length:240 start_codon:yes stop_codon:yes gene_type:complete
MIRSLTLMSLLLLGACSNLECNEKRLVVVGATMLSTAITGSNIGGAEGAAIGGGVGLILGAVAAGHLTCNKDKTPNEKL